MVAVNDCPCFSIQTQSYQNIDRVKVLICESGLLRLLQRGLRLCPPSFKMQFSSYPFFFIGHYPITKIISSTIQRVAGAGFGLFITTESVTGIV